MQSDAELVVDLLFLTLQHNYCMNCPSVIPYIFIVNLL